MPEIFDPDEIAQQLDAITPEQFGRLVAQVVDEQRSSSAYAIIAQVCERVTGWSPDWEDTERLCQRIAQHSQPDSGESSDG